MEPVNPQAGSPGRISPGRSINFEDTNDNIDSTLAAALARLNVVEPPFEKVEDGHYSFVAPPASEGEEQQTINIHVTNRNGALFLSVDQEGPDVTLCQFLEKHGLLPPTPPLPQQLSPVSDPP